MKKKKYSILTIHTGGLTQVALELSKNTDNTYKVNKYYTRGLELISADIIGEVNNHKTYIQDGHGSVTALVENSKITDTYTYDAYGILLKKKNNRYLYIRCIWYTIKEKWRYRQ